MDDEWSLAVLLSALVWAVIGILVGYFVYAIAEPDATSFKYWIRDFTDRGGIWWAFGGAALGGLQSFIRHLESD